ncbi:MAG: hypothetical protein HFF19_05065 [Oscillospiraceae bacterium]|jgi:hypothetical protein|nr:hypothetical protein [Oscillospiraceae bacterium]
MRRFMISELMDEYVDNEVFPQGGETAGVEAVKARVLAKAAPARKKPRPRLKTVLIAAALAVVMVVLCVAAGLPGIFVVSPIGTQITLDDESLHVDYTQRDDYWLLVEDGRFFLNFDGSRTEITGRFDADTPYIHTVSDPSGVTFHYVVGGTPGNYGFTEFEIVPDNSRGEVMPHNTFVTFDAQGKPLLDKNMNLRDRDGALLCPSDICLSDFDDSYRIYSYGEGYILEWRWYTAACEQLGFKGFHAD